MSSKTLYILCGSVAWAALAHTAAAQSAERNTPAVPSASPAATAAETGLDDIVITARKRAAGEALQSTPITASVFSASQIASAAAVDIKDVGRLAPNVSLQQSNQVGQQNFNIRGIGVSGSTVADEPAVGVIQDGVYVANKGGSVTEMFDLESVQILLGPQGTLFGRNVTGGAVVVESRRPDFSGFGGHIEAGYGNGDTKQGQVIVNAPIVGDMLAARFAVLYRDTDGLYHDALNGGHYGKDRTWLIRPSFLLKPTDRLSILWRNEYYSIHGDSNATRGVIPSTVPNAPISTPALAGYREPADYYSIQTNPTKTNQDIYATTLQLDWEILGGKLTSVTGYRKLKVNFDSDFDGTPLAAYRTIGITRQHQISSELRFARSVGNWLNFTSGVYYFKQAFTERDRRLLDGGVTNLATYQDMIDNHSFAAFTEADFTPVGNLTLTLGGRYTTETKEVRLAPYGSCTPDYSACTFGAAKSVTFTNFSPKANLAYKITPNNLVYGSITRGFRSGGFSLSVSGPLASPYRPEKVTQYEIGSKNDFFNHRVRLNLSGYYSDYTDIQRVVIAADPIIGIATSTFNAAKATIYGAEASANIQATDWLRIDAVYGYTHARYDNFLGFANPGKLRFVRVPANTGSVSATIRHRLGNGARLEALGSVSYTSKYFFDDSNTQFQKSYKLVDATLTYRAPSSKYFAMLYARNLTNTEYAVWGSYLGARGQDIYLGTPRSYGIRLGFDF